MKRKNALNYGPGIRGQNQAPDVMMDLVRNNDRIVFI
jgi:hypothetical protein